MNSNYRPIVFAAVMVCLSLCCLSISSAVEFTTSTNITADDTTFDGDDVLVNGCVLTVEGDHSFSTMAITNGGSAEFNGTKLNLTALQLDGSDFELAGGATVDVSNAISLQDASTLLVKSTNTGAKVGDEWAGQGGTVHADDLSVSGDSAISADAQGYAGGSGDNGEGRGPGGGGPRGGLGTEAAGGGYGGDGGSCSYAVGGSSYGSSTAPLGPGSGGASDSSSSGRGGSGGGAIRLDVAGTLTLDGAISADGQSRTASCEGGGSGGAIWATVGTLTGSGNFTADGGDGDGSLSCGGGGGRIAVYYQAGGSFSGFVASTAAKGAGNNSNYDGYEGTVAFFDTSVAGNHLYLYQYLALGTVMDTYGAITLLNGATFALGADSQLEVTGNVVLDEESELDMGGGSELQVGGTLDIKDSSTLLARGKNTNGQVGGVWTGRGLSIEAVNISIDSNSLISADAHGYTGENQSAGNGPGAGAIDNYAAGGAGYGGVGGDGAGSASGGGTYGLAQRPTRLGSGGGGGASSSSGTYGGNGGGAVRIVATGTLQMDGAIRANGGSTSGNHCSGGAGGSIWIDAYDIAGAGSLSANGGAAGLQSGGGGGGRIAVYYWNSSTWPEGNLSLLGGTGTKAGQPGESIVGAKSPYWWQESEIIDCYLSSGSIHLVIDSPLAGWTNNIERASSLQDDDWERVGGFAATESAYIWNDPETSNTPAFYRVISEELE